MADIFSRTKRSQIMQAVRRTRTAPEKTVAQFLRRAKISFRQNVANLPGRPDFVLRKIRVVIFVHGCFWHSHSCTKGKCEPKSNVEFWRNKRIKNSARDRKVVQELRKAGWQVIILWECQLKSDLFLRKKFRTSFVIHAFENSK